MQMSGGISTHISSSNTDACEQMHVTVYVPLEAGYMNLLATATTSEQPACEICQPLDTKHVAMPLTCSVRHYCEVVYPTSELDEEKEEV